MYAMTGEDEFVIQLHGDGGTFVDIGAGDGSSWSHSRLLVEHGWSGLCAECDPVKIISLKHLHRDRENVAICERRVNAENISGILDEANIPKSFQFLSIDIDGMDAYVLMAVLEHRAPETIIIEFNQYVPPPWRFCLDYNPDWVWKVNAQFGASVEHYCDLLVPMGYGLTHLTLPNAIFLNGEPHIEAADLWAAEFVPAALNHRGADGIPTTWSDSLEGICSILGDGSYRISKNPLTISLRER